MHLVLRSRTTLVSLISNAATLSHLSQIHAHLIHHSLNDVAAATKLAGKLINLGHARHALSLFVSVPQPDLFLFNLILKGLATSSAPLSAIPVFTRLRRAAPLCPDDYTFSAAVSAAAASSQGAGVGRVLHAAAVVSGFGSDLFVGSALVDFYFKHGNDGFARKVFDGLPARDTVLFNSVVSGFVRNSRFEDAVGIFGEMVSGGGPGIDLTSVIAVLPAVAELGELRLGMQVQCLAIKFGSYAHVSVLTGLVSLYSKCGDVGKAELVYAEIGRKDVIAHNSMISGYNWNGETESAVRTFRKLLASGDGANSNTVAGLIPVQYPFGHLLLTRCIHGFSVKCGSISHHSVSTALVTVFSRLNVMEYAETLFSECSEKTLALWNTMITGCTQNGQTEKAISLFREMQSSNIDPNPVTVTGILSASAQLGALSLGKWVHNLVKSKNYESNVYVSTALVDMYAKCGKIQEARELFDSMLEKNEVTWNSMISGYGLHGYGKEAVKLYHDMVNYGIRPTAVTFLSVFHACSHAGLVMEGEDIFHSMVHTYRFEPLPKHYACMVDILGRAGQLKKAFEFIKGLPVDPGPPVWSALLGACMIHKDSNLANIASERLLQLDPENMGSYVSLSNIYSSERNYSLAASVRQVAKNRKLVKIPGCTLIEVGEVPHVFNCGDRSHPKSEAIYSELEILTAKMRESGFQTQTSSALHDVEDEEKELMLKVHSEKLAIVFGLISTEPSTEIRIIKNLRVCIDCHTATKFISKISKRVIVVRDANRFHHFKDGVCSCADYW